MGLGLGMGDSPGFLNWFPELKCKNCIQILMIDIWVLYDACINSTAKITIILPIKLFLVLILTCIKKSCKIFEK